MSKIDDKEDVFLHSTKDGRNEYSGRTLISDKNAVGATKSKQNSKLEEKNGAKSGTDISLRTQPLNGSALKSENIKETQKENNDTVKTDKKIALRKRRNIWSIKITVISLFLSAFISFLSDLTASSEHIIVTVLLLLFLILCSILFDGIGVAATSCDMAPFVSMATRRVYGAKTALWLVKNNEKVSNVCNDVIGDIFGIISGACSAAIVVKIITMSGDGWQRWLTIIISSVVAALTIGGKAFLKNIAITNSKEFVFFVARIIGIFHPEERKRKKKQEENKRRYEKKNTEKINEELSDYGEAE